MFKAGAIKLGVHPINWSNDDFFELGDDIPLETCLAEMREAGYVGTELGHKMPKEPAALKEIFKKFDLSLASGWHSTYLASKDYAPEERSFREHLNFLKAMGCNVVIVAECTNNVYTDRNKALLFDDFELIDEAGWNKTCEGLDKLAAVAESEGLRAAYHHHMGTAIQSAHHIDRLMQSTKKLNLLFDSGHLGFAGVDPLSIAEKYKSRIAHVHFKNIRPEVVARVRKEKLSFEKAIKAGAFTVPGDGGIDYKPLAACLAGAGYKGWIVIEAEQDPKKAIPLEYALKARAYLKGLGI